MSRAIKVLVIASQKGGSGKSMLTTNLAVAAEADGFGPVVVIDSDQQQSLATWCQHREAETPALFSGPIAELPATIEELERQGVRLLVVDTAPTATDSIRFIIRCADLVLVPSTKGHADLWSVVETVRIVREEGRPFAFVLNRIRQGTRIATEALTFLSQHGPVAGVVSDRVGFEETWADSRAIAEATGQAKGHEEISAVWGYVAAQLGHRDGRRVSRGGKREGG